MKTFVWPSNSQNVRSSAFDWNNLGSVLNNRNSKRSVWSFEENEKVEEEASNIDPEVQQVFNYCKSTFAQLVYDIKTKSGLSDREVIVAYKAILTAYRCIAEEGMIDRLNQLISQATGCNIINKLSYMSNKQIIQTIDLFIEFLNSKL